MLAGQEASIELVQRWLQGPCHEDIEGSSSGSPGARTGRRSSLALTPEDEPLVDVANHKHRYAAYAGKRADGCRRQTHSHVHRYAAYAGRRADGCRRRKLIIRFRTTYVCTKGTHRLFVARELDGADE
ncbi:unnamed protein product [Chilo suppressalis]|uniref:Uncharacterized protein n=1 Tax=Chilo suppressalis TaxID=168631 RepID=A0ABN8B365_CHISP|nr:unnamed protein product [Chilo suppressalis]